jgi:2-oxoglutarate dehydrogenase complex dehydrogenase (E1) component-like enzyme
MSVLSSADYVDEMYERWRHDPSALSEEWRLFFTGFDLAMCPRDCVSSERATAQSRVASLIFAYRSIGHLIAQTNPIEESSATHPELELEAFDLGSEHLDMVFDTGHLGGPQRITLREIVEVLRDTYCRDAAGSSRRWSPSGIGPRSPRRARSASSPNSWTPSYSRASSTAATRARSVSPWRGPNR